ncbi:DUF6281 family protein [Streptomyces poonensis]|uniref:Secreted protein n=1 Tax=Streptomyces poonensis TaxID=68255 RepID=A0A918PTW1_9ACTN|nr:DUF6281 family protein [Streptomyces poonensis]GGZ22594.1 hypothetical protein GCM10010365_48540 [Streptomyces poonensis]GLJ91838.1 hypothetical protein GCM10017589_44460 [Streptomyces poonensis]
MRAVLPVGRTAFARALVATATLTVSVACVPSLGGETESICAWMVEYKDRMYSDVGDVDVTRGKELGEATFPPCDDTPDDGDEGEAEEPTTAYAIEGLDPGIAIAVEDAPRDVIFVAVDADGELPPGVRDLIDRP